MSIPHLIHFVWIGPPMPDWAVDNIRLFRELNPDCLCQVHGEEVLLPFLKPVYDGIAGDRAFSQRSDILRIAALLRYGGWYFDCDFLPIRPLVEVYRDRGDFPQDAFLTQCDWTRSRFAIEGQSSAGGEERNRRWIANGVIGTSSTSPLLSSVLRAILTADDRYHRSWGICGPILFTDIVEAYPGIVHVDVIDNWYRIRPRKNSMVAYKRIRAAGYCREAIVRELGDALPYAMHMAMENETEL